MVKWVKTRKALIGLNDPVLWYAAYVVALSFITFIVCAYDKFAAKHSLRRTPEKWLFALSLIGGATGMLIGMLTLRHKTRHISFRVFIPLLAILHYMAGLLIYNYC